MSPPKDTETNQAVLVTENDETNDALRRIGHSIGVVALGKTLVLIEGRNTSVDKQTYGSLLKHRHPSLVLVPSAGRQTIASFAAVQEAILKNTIWGVDFFMLCDRDAVSPTAKLEDLTAETEGRLRVLQRYHLENYFLDSAVLARVFDELEDDDSPLRDPDLIEGQLVALAKGQLAYATALYVSAEIRLAAGNVDLMPRGCHQMTATQLADAMATRAASESKRVGAALEDKSVGARVDEWHGRLSQSLQDNTWISLIPGRPILNAFAGRNKLPVGRLRRLYLAKAELVDGEPFADVLGVFDDFVRLANA